MDNITRFTEQRLKLPHLQLPGAVYALTLTTKNRRVLEPAHRSIIQDTFLYFNNDRFVLHLLVIMPDHVHAILEPKLHPNGGFWNLMTLVRSIKRNSSKKINDTENSTDRSHWQKEHFDRIIRDSGEYERVWNYIYNNPLRAGLVEDSQQYPWLFHR